MVLALPGLSPKADHNPENLVESYLSGVRCVTYQGTNLRRHRHCLPVFGSDLDVFAPGCALVRCVPDRCRASESQWSAIHAVLAKAPLQAEEGAGFLLLLRAALGQEVAEGGAVEE